MKRTNSISLLILQWTLIIVSSIAFSSCRTSKYTYKETLTELKESKDTLSTQVSSEVNNVTSEENKTVTASESHVSSEFLSSTLVMMLGSDSDGTLKPTKGILIQQTQSQRKDSVDTYRNECEKLKSEVTSLKEALQQYESKSSMQYNEQTEKRTTKIDVTYIVVAILVIILLFFVLKNKV